MDLYMKKFLIGLALVALVIVGIAHTAPIATNPIPIVHSQDASDSVALQPGQHLEQEVRLSPGTYSAFAIFSSIETLDGRVVRAVIRHTKNNTVVAQGRGNSLSYLPSDNVSRIEIQTTWFTVSRNDFYTVDITLLDGDPLPIRVVSYEDDSPKAHTFSLNGESQRGIIAISAIERVSASSGLKIGMTIGAAFLLAVALISLIQDEKKKYIAGLVTLVVFAPLAVFGYFSLPNMLGIADWDFYFMLHDSYRSAILTHHTFPFWDPYPCGGTAGLADPEFPFFSPTFLSELIFGIPMGVRIAIVISVAIGATGMLTLARRLGRSTEAGLIAALAVAFGSVNLLEVTEGHVNVFAAMWIPWILWAWLGMLRGKTKPIVCGAFLALTFLGGGIYLLMYTTLAFIGLLILVRNRKRAALVTVQAALWALGLAAWKLIPVLLWLRQFPDDAYQASVYTLPWLSDILFGRYLHGSYIVLNQTSGWHEYGAYIGYGVLALALIGVSYIRRNRIVQALTISTIIVIFVSTLGHMLRPLFDLMWFFPRSNISRFILFAVIPLGLLAAYGADRLRAVAPKKVASAIVVLCVGLIAVDIISLTYQISEQAFVLPHVVHPITPAPSPIAYSPDRYDPNGQETRTTRSFDAYRKGYGPIVYCSVLGPKPAVRTIYDEGDTSVVSVADEAASSTLLSWNYNEVRVHVNTPHETDVVLNANYADGWMANGKPASIFSDRVAMHVGPGEQDVTFSYSPPGARMGFIVSLATIVLLGYRFFFLRRG